MAENTENRTRTATEETGASGAATRKDPVQGTGNSGDGEVRTKTGRAPANPGDSNDLGAIRNRKSFGRKLMDKFFSDDPIGVSERVKNEVIWPGVKSLGYNILMSALSMAFWGEVRGGYDRPGGRSSRDDGYRDYSRYSESRGGPPRGSGGSRRPSYDYGDIIFRSQNGAVSALEYLRALINDFGQATVADLNERAELSSKYTDRYYGWYDLRNAGVYPTSEGWMIDLPPTEHIRTY